MMNQKDYKAIAKIIKEEMVSMKILNPNTRTFLQQIPRLMAYKLAGYFEERLHIDFIADEYNRFDKKQFLKDCGVEQ